MFSALPLSHLVMIKISELQCLCIFPFLFQKLEKDKLNSRQNDNRASLEGEIKHLQELLATAKSSQEREVRYGDTSREKKL